MKAIYKSLVLSVFTIGLGVLGVSCEKESFNEQPPKTVHTKVSGLEVLSSKGHDDPFIVMGTVETNNGNGVLKDGELKFIEVGTGEEKTSVMTDSNGEFTTTVIGGEYIIKCYKGGVYQGSSGNISVTENMTIQISL